MRWTFQVLELDAADFQAQVKHAGAKSVERSPQSTALLHPSADGPCEFAGLTLVVIGLVPAVPSEKPPEKD